MLLGIIRIRDCRTNGDKMKVNRIYWIKKINKLSRRLTKFHNAIGFEDKLSINRFINIIDVFLPLRRLPGNITYIRITFQNKVP